MSDCTVFAAAAFLSILPFSELRGAIPFALANGMPLWVSFSFCVVVNALVGPIALLFLETLNRLLQHFAWYRRFFDLIVARARRKVGEKFERYGYIGLILFVAIPLPVTGAWTGTLGAWVLGLSRRKTILSVAAGVLIAGIVVSSVCYFGIEALSFLLKKV